MVQKESYTLLICGILFVQKSHLNAHMNGGEHINFLNILKISEGVFGRELEDTLEDETIDRPPHSMYQFGAYWIDGGFHERTESDSEELPEGELEEVQIGQTIL